MDNSGFTARTSHTHTEALHKRMRQLISANNLFCIDSLVTALNSPLLSHLWLECCVQLKVMTLIAPPTHAAGVSAVQSSYKRDECIPARPKESLLSLCFPPLSPAPCSAT